MSNALVRAVDSSLEMSASFLRGAYSYGVGTRTEVMKWQNGTGWWVGRTMNRTRYDYKTEVGDAGTNSIVVATVGWIARNFPEAPVQIARIESPQVAG